MSKKFKTGNLVIRSDHWRQERCAPNDYQLGIVTEVEFFDEEGKVVCYPAIHWEGEVIARSTHPDNADVTTWQEVLKRKSEPKRLAKRESGIAAHRAWESVRGDENECDAECRMRHDERAEYSTEFWHGWFERSDEWRDEIGHDSDEPSSDGTRRPSREVAEKVIREWLDEVAPGYPTFSMCPDGDDDSAKGKCGWAFWICPHDTTSYLHEDLTVEWYGTGWPGVYVEDPDTGVWHEAPVQQPA